MKLRTIHSSFNNCINGMLLRLKQCINIRMKRAHQFTNSLIHLRLNSHNQDHQIRHRVVTKLNKTSTSSIITLEGRRLVIYERMHVALQSKIVNEQIFLHSFCSFFSKKKSFDVYSLATHQTTIVIT